MEADAKIRASAEIQRAKRERTEAEEMAKIEAGIRERRK